MPEIITEAGAVTAKTGGRLRIKIIDEGQGSSGFYPAEVLEQAATDKVFKAGTLMFADHPTESEDWQRPERSIKDLAGVLATDAVYEDGALYAEAKVFSGWREPLAEMADTIGVSIRAGAEVAIEDNGGGPVQVIKRLTYAASVDFVTMAGRGGAILEVLESARFDLVTEQPQGSPSDPAGANENANTKEHVVAKIEIEESELTQLRESAGRVTALETELAEANRKNADSEKAARESRANAIVAEAFGDIEAKATRKALIAAALVGESLDEAALKADAVEAAAEYKAAHGEGTVHGVGDTAPPPATESKKTITDADIVAALHGEAK